MLLELRLTKISIRSKVSPAINRIHKNGQNFLGPHFREELHLLIHRQRAVVTSNSIAGLWAREVIFFSISAVFLNFQYGIYSGLGGTILDVRNPATAGVHVLEPVEWSREVWVRNRFDHGSLIILSHLGLLSITRREGLRMM